MYTNVVEVLDMSVIGGKIACSAERYAITDRAGAPLVLSWNDTAPRHGFRPVGGGVAHVRAPDYMALESVSAAPDDLGNGEFAWRDTAHTGNMIVVVLLPADYVIKTLSDTMPVAVRFKVFNSRMAFYWDIQERTTDLRWRVTKKGTRHLDKLCAELNKAALDIPPQALDKTGDTEGVPAPDLQDTQVKLRRHPSKWEQITVTVLVAIIILSVLYAALRKDEIPARNFTLLRILLSAAMGVMGGVIPGFLRVDFSFRGAVIRAGGGLALGILTYFFTPQVVPNDLPRQTPGTAVVTPASEASAASRHLEIAAFDFSEDYEKRATAGAWPQFDLTLRNATGEPVVISGLRFNVSQVWTLKPTPDPVSKPVAEVLHPSAVYDVVIGPREEQSNSKPTEVRDGKLGFSISGQNSDPKIETFTKRISHFIKPGDADRLLLTLRVVHEFAYIDPATRQPSRKFFVTPFYVILLNVTVIYNAGGEVTSENMIFAHYIDDQNRWLITDPGYDGFSRSREDRIANNLKAIADINARPARKAPSVRYAATLVRELAGKPAK